MTNNKRDNKVSDCCDDILIDYIDSFGSNLANLRQDIRSIIREEVEQAIKHLRDSNPSPKKYVEVGYR